MKYVSQSSHNQQIHVRCSPDELNFFRHCIEQRRAALSRLPLIGGELEENIKSLIRQCDRRISEIEVILSDLETGQAPTKLRIVK